jgi:hypothetical protein
MKKSVFVHLYGLCYQRVEIKYTTPNHTTPHTVGEQAEIAVEYRIGAKWRRLHVGIIGDKDTG